MRTETQRLQRRVVVRAVGVGIAKWM